MAPRTFRFNDDMDKLCEAVRYIVNYNQAMEIAPNDTKVIEFALKQAYDVEKAREVSKVYMRGLKQQLINISIGENLISIFVAISDKIVELSLKNMSLPHIEIREIIKAIRRNGSGMIRTCEDMANAQKYAQVGEKRQFYKSYLDTLFMYLYNNGCEAVDLEKLFLILESIMDEHDMEECIHIGEIVD